MEVKKILFTSILFFILMDSCASAGEVPDYTMKINFSNVTGSTIIDEAGGASGTLFNVARTQLPSGAFYGTFGGNSSSYVDLTNREDLDFGSNFTIEAWIRPEIPNEHGAILAKGSGQAGYQYMLSDTGNICAPFANFTNSGWVYCGSQSSLDNNSWYQVVWTVETNNTEGFPQHNRAYIYVNMDRSLPTTTDGQILGSNSYNAYLGKGGYGNYKGDILILRVYRRILSPAEIYQNYVATAPLVMPEVKIENSSYMFENGAGSQNINITLDSEAVNTVSYVDVRTFDGTANSSDYNTDNNSNSGLIAAIGDSITEASDVYYNNAHGYVGYLSQNLSAADNWTIINYGVGGYTTNNILSEYYSYVQPYHPSYGILLIGTNDIFRDVKSATYVENNIETIVGRMVEDNVTPILTTIPPSNTRTIETNNTMTTVNAWIRDYAAINGYHYVDLYALLADPNNPDLMMDDMTTDGLHLSALGCEVWSSAINPEWFKNDRRRVYFFPGDTLATFNTEILNNPESGNKTFKVDLFTPSGVYFSGVQESSVTIVDPVQNTTPSITWNSPADITYGTALSSTQLDAVATDPVTGNNVPGNFVYTPPAGTLLDVGTHTLHVDFTPDNSANYTTASKDVTINVIDQATPSGEVPGYTMMINFSNVTGSTIIDEAGGASGTLFNVARTQLPSGAYYGTFGGNSSSYVDLTNREDLDFGSNFTIEAWIRPDIPNGYGAIMAKGSGQAGYQYMLSDTGNICTPYANFTNSGWVYCGSQSILDNNSWYQVVWTVETNSTEGFPQHNRAYIYVNMDRSLPSTTNGQIVGSSSYNAYLGKGGYGNYKGDILFVRVYRKMLSPAEIYQNYVATAPLVMPEVKIENSSYMFENGAGSQNINITLDGEAVNTVSYVDVRAFGGTANSSDYNTDNNSNSGLIAAIGDSITEGSNVYYNNAHGYVGYLSQNLSAVDNWTIINYGVGGYTTDNVLSEYNSYVHPYHPSYGILLIGTNDIFRDVKSATYVENNIEIIVGRMVEDNVTPILTTIPPSSTSTVETNSTLTAVNAWIRNYAATNGYYCVDLYSLLADPIDPSTMKADMTTDGIHLSQLGYQVWSNAINPEWFKNDRRRVYFFPGDTLATFNTEILNNPGSGNKTFKVDLFTPSGVYFPGVQESTIIINESKAIPLITWDNPANITYGTALSSTQLNAVATDPVTGNNVPGNFVYTPYAGTLLGVGTHTLQVDFTPYDSANYTTASKTVTINVSKTAPIITWSTPANITYGTALNSSQLNAVASVSGTFVYTPSAGTVLDVGTHTLHVDFTPADTINYTTATADVTINVSERTKATPEITWSDPADITYGTALNEAQLNALASVPGSFVYSPAYGTILGAGTQTLQTTFTPADSVNYTTATGSVSLTVNKATPLITWSNPDAISYGTALSSTQLNAVASVPGSFVYSPASGTVLSAGTHDLQANFTPADSANYTTASKSVTINVLSQPILPVADFNASVFSGYAPLSVLFTDRSQNTTSWSWDFGDGATSVKQNPKHVYSSAGIYTVRLTAVNANGTDLKTATITVDKKTRGKSSNSNNNGGSPEFAKNIEVKELSQAFIVKGKTVQFDFTKNATCVVYVGFDAKKTVSGKTATIAEQLKNKSTLVSGLPGGEVYNYFNVWVGNSEFATSNNIENPVLCFKVEKSWIQDKNIDRDSIFLNRYSNRAWEKLSTSFSGEDDKYLYFESNVPGYSFFAITWKSDAFLEETVIDIQPGDSSEENKKETGSEIDLESNEKKESPGMPGFDMVYGIAGLLVVLLYKKIKVY